MVVGNNWCVCTRSSHLGPDADDDVAKWVGSSLSCACCLVLVSHHWWLTSNKSLCSWSFRCSRGPNGVLQSAFHFWSGIRIQGHWVSICVNNSRKFGWKSTDLGQFLHPEPQQLCEQQIGCLCTCTFCVLDPLNPTFPAEINHAVHVSAVSSSCVTHRCLCWGQKNRIRIKCLVFGVILI